jgi:acetyltransferase
VEAALAEGVLVLSGFDNGLRALGHLVRASAVEDDPASVGALAADAEERVEAVFAEMAAGSNGGPLAMRLLQAAGIPVPPYAVVSVERAGAESARRLRFPVVAKIGDEEVAHKSDRGGVILGITSPQALESAVSTLLDGGASSILVQEQVGPGTELIVGIHVAEPLGRFVLVGMGGIWTELLDDVQLGASPLSEGESAAMVRRLKGHQQLLGARGTESLDVDGLSAVIERLDALSRVLGERIASIDVNPLIVTAAGVVAVDALVVKA